jgi:hypothetical protein
MFLLNALRGMRRPVFATLVEEKSAVMSVWWKHREPGEPAGWLLDLLREEDCLFV